MSKTKKVPVLGGIIEELGKFGETASSQVTGSDKSSEEETKEVVKHLYGADEKTANTEAQGSPQRPQKEDDQQKLAKLRQELHSKYYQRTFNPPKPKEERPAERVEKQEKENRWKLEEKKAKEKPIIVRRAAEKTEKYPGASG